MPTRRYYRNFERGASSLTSTRAALSNTIERAAYDEPLSAGSGFESLMAH